MTVENLIEKSRVLNKLRDSKIIFEELNKIEPDILIELVYGWQPVKDFKPVILLRFLIAQSLLNGKRVDNDAIQKMKAAIERRDISEYYDLPAAYKQSMQSYKKSDRGMFPQWKDSFRILFPFFYTRTEKEQTKKALHKFAEELIDHNSITDTQIHIVDFDGSQNYGDDLVWMALIPEKAPSVQDAYQLFFRVDKDGYSGGLYKGHRLSGNGFTQIDNRYSTLEDYLKSLNLIIPQWQALNETIYEELSEDEAEFKDRIRKLSLENLNTYFNALDQIIEELSLLNEDNLVFSTASKQLSFQVGRRYCLNLKNNKFSFIAPEDYNIPGIEKEAFTGGANAAYFKNNIAQIVQQHINAITEAVDFEIERNNKTDPKEYDNTAFRKAVFDKEYRATFFNFDPTQLLFTVKDTAIKANKNKSPMLLNQILFGPPGTGKTFNTINLALEILGEKTDNIERTAIKRIFERRVADGQIMFTTFHQSMSYEDFIEGIKPKSENEKLLYEIEEGIFKSICNKARPSSGNFEEVIEAFKKEISEADGKEPLTITSKASTFDVVYRGTNVFYVQPHNSVKDKPWYPVNILNVRKAYESGSFDGVYNPTYVREIIKHLEKHRNLVKGSLSDETVKPYVLIIDEINRGNVSQIFGELITLIEEDKRLGKDEQLEVTLPYSKEKFGVPANLYIIGTMNTADRSVEALDTALRRRFSFVEMPPRYDLEGLQQEVEGYKLADILKKINRRIEKLLGKDNLIGHSYFLCVENTDNLRAAFQNKIIPLLQEYFYGDYGKIGLVLGEGFFKELDKVEEADIFASFGNYDPAGLSEKQVYHLAELIGKDRLSDDDFKSALEKLMK
ncbi:McrB family protein [Pontibacter lucknowensis]|uniref:AAA domain (Dynein-related subfamily) n=1 Tax=Pontibacter lucknowensis TaxID=1077936 RepID=A0A1N6XB53_9BACT|nr:AAA family ATPase [Pontibacter lucknowensis]SIQ99595.1 AAA domain (dynein-related subfamily) [Pontibacter lucknowensis]